MNKTSLYKRNEGFMLLPRTLLKQAFHDLREPVGEEMALLIILYRCNYSDQGEVKRGEALLSIPQWSELFHWTISQTRRFFNKLEQEGVLSKRYKGTKRILCVMHYEEICGKYAAHPSAREQEERMGRPTKTELDFGLFWEHYHEVNREIEPSDKELAWKEWKKLSAEERRLAHERVYDYYLSMRDISHSKKAYNYLRHRSFLM